MAIDTTDKKVSVMSMCQVFLAALPVNGTLDQAEKQHMLWGYSGTLWGELVATVKSGMVSLYLRLDVRR